VLSDASLRFPALPVPFETNLASAPSMLLSPAQRLEQLSTALKCSQDTERGFQVSDARACSTVGHFSGGRPRGRSRR
jgi:hypothetical protein